jgi:hypothetical protein
LGVHTLTLVCCVCVYPHAEIPKSIEGLFQGDCRSSWRSRRGGFTAAARGEASLRAAGFNRVAAAAQQGCCQREVANGRGHAAKTAIGGRRFLESHL